MSRNREMRVQEPIRAVVGISAGSILAMGWLVGMPWLPMVALVAVPLIIGVPVEVARHWDRLDQRLLIHSNRRPDEPEQESAR